MSPGCANCYAEGEDKRRCPGDEHWGAKAPRRMLSDAHWKQPFAWNRKAREAGTPARVFCASMADVFEDHPDVTESRARLWRVIGGTPWLVWLLLTKRPENIAAMVPEEWFDVWPANVWPGTSVEDQQRADERIPHLLEVPAPVRFLSCEPLLGPVELTGGYHDYLGANPGRQAWKVEPGHAPACNCGEASYTGETPTCPIPEQVATRRVDWVIAGGESGSKARPMHPVWAKSLRDQCLAAEVPFLFKQWGAWVPSDRDHGLAVEPDGAHRPLHESLPSPASVRMSKVGKKKAGRVLDGRTWDDFPPLPVVAETTL